MEAYFDNSATTKVLDSVKDIVVKTMTEDYGNPAAKHRKGMEAEQYIREARKIIADSMKVQEKEILFTSGGSESNNMALICTAWANQRAGKHIISTAIEHPSVYNPLGVLEELGFELPDPAKKKGKYNNRKMNFDAECRKLFLEIAQRNGVQVECEPVYGGAGYLEKQDFIIENQKKRIAEKQAVLDEITMRVLDMENFVEQVAEDAYEKACEAVSDTMAEQTRAEDIEELRRYKKWLTSDERKTPKDKRDFVGRCLDNLENRLRGMAQKVAGKVMETLQNPRIKEQKKSEVKEHARKSVRALLEANRKLVEEQRAKVAETPAHKKARGEELG